jgi:hypothetical protein
MGAINVLFAVLSSYLFTFSLLIMLFLPLARVIVALNVDVRYYIVYLLGTLFLALIINLANIENTLFFLLPILLSGLAFGLLIKRQWPDILILIIVSGVNLVTMLITIPIINLIYAIDFLNVFASFIGFSDLEFGKLILPSILTLLAFMQTLLTLIIIHSDAHYFQIVLRLKHWKYAVYMNVVMIFITVLLSIYSPPLALALLFIICLLSTYELIQLYAVNRLNGLLIAATAFSFLFIGIAVFRTFSDLKPYFGVIIAAIPIVIADFLWLYNSSIKSEAHDERII